MVSIVDAVAVLAVKEAEEVVLYDGVLGDGTRVGTGGLSADAVTDGKDIFKTVVLESIAVNIDLAISITDTRIEDELVLFARWVDGGT